MSATAEKPTKKQNWFKRHKILTVIIALFVIGMIGASTSGNQSNTNSSNTAAKSSSNSSSPKAPAAATTPKIGQPANDGKFSFIINKISCGETSLSDSFGNAEATAQGQFCRVNVTVKNIGNESQSLDETSQYLYDASGKKYSLSTEGTIWAQPADQDPWGNDINPGNSLTADMMFDVPKGVTPATAELHDSSLSGGVKVSLQ